MGKQALDHQLGGCVPMTVEDLSTTKSTKNGP